jgi:hypothetical protein
MTIRTEEGFQAWKDSPLTREYLQFLRDRQAALMRAWAEGKSLTPEHQAQAVLLGQLAEIRWHDVAEQYGIEVRDDDNRN